MEIVLSRSFHFGCSNQDAKLRRELLNTLYFFPFIWMCVRVLAVVMRTLVPCWLTYSHAYRKQEFLILPWTVWDPLIRQERTDAQRLYRPSPGGSFTQELPSCGFLSLCSSSILRAPTHRHTHTHVWNLWSIILFTMWPSLPRNLLAKQIFVYHHLWILGSLHEFWKPTLQSECGLKCKALRYAFTTGQTKYSEVLPIKKTTMSDKTVCAK